MLSPAEADALIGQYLTCLPIESLPLTQCTGAVLRENIYAERDQPPFDRVAMDGIAIDGNTWVGGRREFLLQAMQAAGDPALTLQSKEYAIEIMTGAVLPRGCDTVVPIEKVTLENGNATIAATVPARCGTNVHRRASDGVQGSLLLTAGSRLGAAEIAVAASAGMARIRVSAQPRIIVISTGNELVEPGDPIDAHQIRRSNVYGVMTALRARGFSRIADDHLPDELEALTQRLRVHLNTQDILILSGGVSMGKLDLVPEALTQLGVKKIFHRIAQKPGKPMWFGVAPSGTAVFALPGNPVSTLVCLARYVIPALYTAMGISRVPAEKISLAADYESTTELSFFLPVRVRGDDWGMYRADPAPTQGSGDFTALTGSDGIVELPPGPNRFPKGFVCRLHRW